MYFIPAFIKAETFLTLGSVRNIKEPSARLVGTRNAEESESFICVEFKA